MNKEISPLRILDKKYEKLILKEYVSFTKNKEVDQRLMDAFSIMFWSKYPELLEPTKQKIEIQKREDNKLERELSKEMKIDKVYKSNSKVKNIDWKIIQSKYDSGYSANDIYKEFGVYFSALRTAESKGLLKLRKTLTESKNDRMNNANWTLIKQRYYEDKWSIRKICAEFGLHSRDITDALLKNII